MNVRFKMTNKGEVAILPRKEFEALAAKAREADEDVSTARLVARARREIAAGMPLVPKDVVDRICAGENALRVVRKWRGKTQLYISQKARACIQLRRIVTAANCTPARKFLASLS